MRELVVISGKGGTGKTSITAAFVALAERPAIADCDVDAADLHLVLSPEIERREVFHGGKKASVAADRCVGCGRCLEVCRFDAVRKAAAEDGSPRCVIDELACEGCGVCTHFCEHDAIRFEPADSGEWFESRTRFGPMVHAKLGIGDENSGKLVALVRKRARAAAEREGIDLVLVDGPPGIGCPVIASITGARLVLVVTEPTLSGQHDLERVAEVARHFRIPVAATVNKCDLNEEMTRDIERRARDSGIDVMPSIPYDVAVTRAQLSGTSVVEQGDSLIARRVARLWQDVRELLDGKENAGQ